MRGKKERPVSNVKLAALFRREVGPAIWALLSPQRGAEGAGPGTARRAEPHACGDPAGDPAQDPVEEGWRQMILQG
eukprot:6086387-Pyramimonas_sp.AAC.1